MRKVSQSNSLKRREYRKRNFENDRKRRKENGTIDYSKQLNNAWFIRLREIQKQSTTLLETNPEAKQKISKAIKAIKRRKLINSLVYIVVVLSLFGIFVAGNIADSKSAATQGSNEQTISSDVQE